MSPEAAAIWRRNLIPACPNCRREVARAVHVGCKGVVRDSDADLYIDITSGQVRCAACGHSGDFTDTRSHCTHCSAVYEGGEIWQGMAAEIGSAGNLLWLKAAGVQRGTLEITFLGWSSCLACRRLWNEDIGWLQTGARYGGLCVPCHDAALARFSSLLKFWGRAPSCSFCRASKGGGLDLVKIGHAGICENCSDRVWRKRQALPPAVLQMQM